MSKKTRVISILCIIIFGTVSIALMYTVQRAVPFMMDDEWYATKLFSDEPINGIEDIFDAQLWHYLNWGGRSIAHTLLQIILLQGELVADVLNVLMQIMTGIIVTLMANTFANKKNTFAENIISVVLAIGAIHGLNANWKMSMYWEAGAANYLYMTIFILIYVWCYLREIRVDCREKAVPIFGISLWIIPLALIVGWSNENMGPTCFLVSVATIIYTRKTSGKEAVRGWMYIGSVICFIGSVVCICAPGNFARSHMVSNDYGLLWKAYLQSYAISKASLEFLFPTIIVTFSLIGVTVGCYRMALGMETIMLLGGALASWGAMILSPHYPDRATYGTMLFLIVACFTMAKRIIEKNSKMRIWIYLGGIIVWLRGMYYLFEFMGIVWGWIK